jgi:hypothetical protein
MRRAADGVRCAHCSAVPAQHALSTFADAFNDDDVVAEVRAFESARFCSPECLLGFSSRNVCAPTSSEFAKLRDAVRARMRYRVRPAFPEFTVLPRPLTPAALDDVDVEDDHARMLVAARQHLSADEILEAARATSTGTWVRSASARYE